MNRGLRRRRFLQMASALGLGAELAPWANLRTITPLRAEDAQLKPDMVKFRPEIEPVVRLIEDTPRDRALEVVIAQLKKGLSYKQPARRTVPRGHPQYQAPPGRLQVSRRDGDQFGARSGPIIGSDRAAAAAALGTRQFQRVAGARCQGRGLGARSPSTNAGCPSRITRRRNLSSAMEKWDAGGGRCGRRSTVPQFRSGRDHGAPWRAGRARSARYRSQGDFRGPELANVADDRLGACRARACARSSSGCSTSRATAAHGPSDRTRPIWKTPPRFARNGPIGRDDPAATQALLQVIRRGDAGSSLCRGRQVAQPGDCPWFALGCRDPGRLRALDAQPRNPRHSRHDGDKRSPLHLYSQRRRYDSPARLAAGSRLAADVSRTCQADRRDRHRLAQSEPGRRSSRAETKRSARSSRRSTKTARKPVAKRWPTWPAVVRRISSSTPLGG